MGPEFAFAIMSMYIPVVLIALYSVFRARHRYLKLCLGSDETMQQSEKKKQSDGYFVASFILFNALLQVFTSVAAVVMPVNLQYLREVVALSLGLASFAKDFSVISLQNQSRVFAKVALFLFGLVIAFTKAFILSKESTRYSGDLTYLLISVTLTKLYFIVGFKFFLSVFLLEEEKQSVKQCVSPLDTIVSPSYKEMKFSFRKTDETKEQKKKYSFHLDLMMALRTVECVALLGSAMLVFYHEDVTLPKLCNEILVLTVAVGAVEAYLLLDLVLNKPENLRKMFVSAKVSKKVLKKIEIEDEEEEEEDFRFIDEWREHLNKKFHDNVGKLSEHIKTSSCAGDDLSHKDKVSKLSRFLNT